jgi:hypothetical protein
MSSNFITTSFYTSNGIETISCDGKCHKAWGVNGRQLENKNIRMASSDEEDVVFLSDADTPEMSNSSQFSNVFEGGQGKPEVRGKHNKWCMRECERSCWSSGLEDPKVLDFSYEVYNKPEIHNVENHYLDI